MKIEKMTANKFLQDVANCFQEGDTLKWEDGYISHYGEGMNILAEFNTATDEAIMY